MRPGEMFTWIDPGDGRLFTFNVWSMAKYAATRPPSVERIQFTIDPAHVAMILAHRSVDVSYARRLTLAELRVPLIGVEMPDGTTLTVDGHHRYWRWFDLGMPDALMDRFAVDAYAEFLVTLDPAYEAQIRREIAG